MILAIDPNIFRAASLGDALSLGLLDTIDAGEEFLRYGVDNAHVFQEAYESVLDDLIDSMMRDGTVLQVEDVSKLLQRVLDDWDNLTIEIPAQQARNIEFFEELRCNYPIEPQLIAISATSAKPWLIMVGDCSQRSLLQPRGLHDDTIREKVIRDHFPDLKIYTRLDANRTIASWLKENPMYPSNEFELKTYLDHNNYEENDHLEFKQPLNDPSPQGLTHNILKKCMSEICGLSNAHGGKVIVGIYEKEKHKGEVTGFPLAYRRKKETRFKPKTKEEIYSILWGNDFLGRFTPPLRPEEININFVELGDGQRYALIFHVNKYEEVRLRKYGSKSYIRRETSTIEVKEANLS